jgi:hypothetical protein
MNSKGCCRKLWSVLRYQKLASKTEENHEKSLDIHPPPQGIIRGD